MKQDKITLSHGALCAFHINEYKAFIKCIRNGFAIDRKAHGRDEAVFRLTIQNGKTYFTKFDSACYITYETNAVCANNDISLLVPHGMLDKAKGVIEIISIDMYNTITARVNGVDTTCVTVEDEADNGSVPDFSNAQEYTLSADTFAKIKRAFAFASKESYTPIVQFVYADNGDVVATNSKRMAIYKCNDIPANAKLLFPPSIKAFPDGECRIQVQKTLMHIKVANVTAELETCDKKYVNYKSVIPTDKGTCVTFNLAELKDTLKKLSGFYTRLNDRCILLKIKNNVCVIKTVNHDGEQSLSVACTYEGRYEIAFNGAYISSLLDDIKSESVTMEYRGDTSPTTICSDETGVIYLIMPLRKEKVEE